MDRLYTVIAILVFFFAPHLHAGESREASPAPSAEQIQRWVRDLNAKQFDRRKRAMEYLTAAGEPAVEPVARVVRRGSLEAATRGIHVLQTLSLSGDDATELAASSALTSIALEEQNSAGQQSRAALQLVRGLWHDRALERLEPLGVRVHVREYPFGFELHTETIVEIDKTFSGDLSDLDQLGRLTSIDYLTIEGAQVTDAWLERLARFDRLENLIVKRASITNAGIARLADAKSIRGLSLMYNPVDDQCVDDLKTMHTLVYLRVYGGKITRAGADELVRGLATTRVDYRRGAFLGVGCAPHPLGCLITQVHEPSAAHDAGFLPNDILVKYNGERVPDFETLTAMISENSSGEKATVELLRGGQSLSKNVVLGEWE